MKGGNGFVFLSSCENGAQEEKLCGGTQQLSEGLATFVKKSGGEILLDHVVNSISQNEKGVTVKCRNGTVFKSKYVCISIPPTLASRIEYEPALPYTRDGITQRIPMGSIIKTHTYYEKPFWREKGFSGQIVSDKGPVCATFDDCCYDGKSYFGIMGFVLSNDAMEFRKKTKKERGEAIAEQYATQFQIPEMKKPIYYDEKDWSEEEFSRGCYVGLLPPGAMTKFKDALKQPCGRIHWAGTETADQWHGYMEGAISSGVRASKEILSLI